MIYLFVTAGTLWSQVSSGTITGIVTDPTQARVAGAQLVLVQTETGVSQSVTANEAGEYTFPYLASGTYRMDVNTPGFKGYVRQGIVVELGRTLRIDIALNVGEVSETVTVDSSAPLLDTESATVGQLIENRTINDMPLNGRRVGELLGLMGNAVFVSGDVIRPRVAVGGGRADQQQWLLDGVNASNVALEAPQALFNPPVEAVQEIRVQQNGYSAEYGNSSSGVVVTTTKSGTNRLTGSLYEYFRNEKLDARNFFAAERAPLRWNVFGFAVGGPIVLPKVYNGRNRSFFFISTEWQKQRIGVTRNLTVPTTQQIGGDFSQSFNANGSPQPIYDPFTNPRLPFAGNVIPRSRMDPVGIAMSQFFPTSNRAGANAAGANNFVANAVNALNITTTTAKIDHVFTERDRVSGRIVVHDFPTFSTAVFPVTGSDPNANSQERRAYSFLTEYLHQFTPTLINNLRVNIQPRRFHFQSAGLGEGWPTQLGLRGVSDRAFPRVNTTGYTAMGNTNHERLQTPIWDHHIVNSVSWFRGSHSVSFGGEVRYGRNVDNWFPAASGNFTFGIQPTARPGVNGSGNGLATLLMGFPTAANIRETLELDRTSIYYAGFIQEDWKVTPTFTLNLGLRWETHTPRIDANDRQSGFDRATINPVSNTPGVITFASLDGMGRTVYDGDYNNIMPRFGFAWKPGFLKNTVIRSSYGIFYGPPLPGSNSASAGFETSGSFQTPDNGITAPFLLRDGMPAVPATANLGPGFGAVPFGRPIQFSPEFHDRNRQLGYTQQWNLTIQREIGWNTITEMSYMGNVGRKLNGPNTSINQVPLNQMAAGNAQVRRPFPQFGNVTMIAPFWGNSDYHAFNAKIEKRFSDGVNFLANYTFSKFMDDVASGFEAGATSGGIQNIYDRSQENALSGNDVRHRLSASGVWELPGKNVIIKGWSFGMIAVLQGGAPIGATVQVNNCNCFNPGALRANILRDPTLPADQRTVERWFDTTALAAPALFTFGNAARSVTRGPGLLNLDLSLIRTFSFTERWRMQFRAESFNFINRANFEDPGIALGAPGFGVIGGTRTNARSIQLGLKLMF
ncbi:MAG: carboxypeptidase regulatory-like domain-containing protein [Bryobacterales bacterium]|nr:carboxypeptidase regulatory-like domain-containing protein [Bryobacterales bacterium]